MSDDLKKLIEEANKVPMSNAAAEQQRRSFAYGNTKFENERITKAMVNEAADELRRASRG